MEQVRRPGSHTLSFSPYLPLVPQMLLCYLNGKWVRSWQGRGCLSHRREERQAQIPSGAPEASGPLRASVGRWPGLGTERAESRGLCRRPRQVCDWCLSLQIAPTL